MTPATTTARTRLGARSIARITGYARTVADNRIGVFVAQRIGANYFLRVFRRVVGIAVRIVGTRFRGALQVGKRRAIRAGWRILRGQNLHLNVGVLRAHFARHRRNVRFPDRRNSVARRHIAEQFLHQNIFADAVRAVSQHAQQQQCHRETGKDSHRLKANTRLVFRP